MKNLGYAVAGLNFLMIPGDIYFMLNGSWGALVWGLMTIVHLTAGVSTLSAARNAL